MKTVRDRIATRLLGLATWALPDGHPAIDAIYDAAWAIDDPDWLKKRNEQAERMRDAAWFSIAMNAAAEIEDAEKCLRDQDAKQSAKHAAEYYREQANALWKERWRVETPNAADKGPA